MINLFNARKGRRRRPRVLSNRIATRITDVASALRKMDKKIAGIDKMYWCCFT